MLILSPKAKELVIDTMREATDRSGFESASMFVSTAGGGSALGAAIGPVAEKLEGLNLAAGVGIVGRVIESAKAIVTEDAAQHQAHHRPVAEQVRYSAHEMICVPIMDGGSCRAALQVMNKGGSLTERDILIIERAAAQIGSIMASDELATIQEFLPACARNNGLVTLERKAHGTVMVLDLAESTGLVKWIEKTQDRGISIQKTLSSVFSQLTPQIEKTGGIVIDISGDAILSFYKDQAGLERSEVRAFLGALFVEKAFERFKLLNLHEPFNTMKLHVGLTNGVVEIGPIATPGRSVVTINGSPVNECFELAKSPMPLGQATDIRMSAEFYKKLLG